MKSKIHEFLHVQNRAMSKKIMLALLFLSATIQMTFAKTGTVSDDEIIIWLPVLLIAVIWMGYKVRIRLKEKKNREAQEMMEQNAAENSATPES